MHVEGGHGHSEQDGAEVACEVGEATGDEEDAQHAGGQTTVEQVFHLVAGGAGGEGEDEAE